MTGECQHYPAGRRQCQTGRIVKRYDPKAVVNEDQPAETSQNPGRRLKGKQRLCYDVPVEQGRLAQLVRVLARHARGQWFESTTAHQIFAFVFPSRYKRLKPVLE